MGGVLTYGSLMSFVFYFNVFSTIALIRKIQRKEVLPEKIADFPMQITSEGDYRLAKQKIIDFVQILEIQETAELLLTQTELNHLYLRGHSVDQYAAYFVGFEIFSNEYFHFDIRDESLWLRQIRYPDSSGRSGIFTETKRIKFINSDDTCLEEILITEFNDRDMTVPILPKYRDYLVFDLPPYQRTNALDESYVLLCIFGAIPVPKPGFDSFRNDFEYQEALKVIKKITQIQVIDNVLVVKVL
jgi:hypothetical protein